MHTRLALLLSSIFVVLGGLNVWLMLGSRAASSNPRLYIFAHRTAGYVFILLYSVMMYHMVLRLKGIPDEVSPRILLHMFLALLLAPLLVLKILVARYQKTLQGVLRALGISIFAISFTLVALNVVTLVLRTSTTGRVSPLSSTAFLLLVSTLLGMLWLRRPVSAPAAESIDSGARSSDLNEALAFPTQPSNRALSLLLSRMQPQTADAKTLRFLLPPNQRWSARPGQFLTFEWMIDGKRSVRSYSICSSPTQSAYVEITPKRVPNGQVSTFLNQRAAPGLMVTARGPYGQFYFDEQKHKRIVLIAGGSGITPMMSMLRYIDDRFIPVEVMLIYCVRTEEDVFFGAELMELQCRLATFRCIVVLSQPHRDWKGPSGRLNRELLEANLEQFAAATVFLCGPGPFMENARKLLVAVGIDPANIKQENFNSKPSAQPSPDPAGMFEVEFVRSGRTCRIPQTKTLLEVAEMNGLSLPFGCREGECGTCATRLLAGEVRMGPANGLEDDLRAQGYILPCVSQACTSVKLDF